MNKVKTLANQNYWILEEEDNISDIIESINNEIIGSNQQINDSRLILNNECYRMKKKIEEYKSDLIIKKAKERDAKDIARLINKGMINVPNTIEYKKRFVETLIHGEFNEFHYIYDEHTLIGLAEICLEEDIPEITSIIVLEKYRNQGYGKQILSLIENYLGKEYDEVSIVVSNKNPIAYHLYESIGYKKQETVMYYYERRLS